MTDCIKSVFFSPDNSASLGEDLSQRFWFIFILFSFYFCFYFVLFLFLFFCFLLSATIFHEVWSWCIYFTTLWRYRNCIIIIIIILVPRFTGANRAPCCFWEILEFQPDTRREIPVDGIRYDKRRSAVTKTRQTMGRGLWTVQVIVPRWSQLSRDDQLP